MRFAWRAFSTGALRSAIHDHGPITPERIGSAVKRIRGALRVDHPMIEPQRLLTDAEVEEIRWGVREGIRGPIMLKWVEQLLRDRDERAPGWSRNGRPGCREAPQEYVSILRPCASLSGRIGIMDLDGLAGASVLVGEDHADLSEMLRLWLKRAGARVREAGNGKPRPWPSSRQRSRRPM
jgi:hypothetical protein